jgi:hypothetical protein
MTTVTSTGRTKAEWELERALQWRLWKKGKGKGEERSVGLFCSRKAHRVMRDFIYRRERIDIADLQTLRYQSITLCTVARKQLKNSSLHSWPGLADKRSSFDDSVTRN